VIRENKELQCLECTICKEAVELRRRTASRPDLVALIKEQMAKEHKPCELFPDNPSRASAERRFAAGVRAELAKLERRNKR